MKDSLTHAPMGTKTFGGEVRCACACLRAARWLPSLWGLEKKGGSFQERRSEIENFLHAEELVQRSERNSESE